MVTRACLRYAREGQNVTQAGPKCHTSRAKMSHKGQNVTQSCYKGGYWRQSSSTDICVVSPCLLGLWRRGENEQIIWLKHVRYLLPLAKRVKASVQFQCIHFQWICDHNHVPVVVQKCKDTHHIFSSKGHFKCADEDDFINSLHYCTWNSF